MRRKAAVLLLATLAGLSGCKRERARPQRGPSGPAAEKTRSLGIDPESARGRARALQEDALTSFRASLGRSLATRGTWQYLALSGGGQWGAFGAGFMKGWTERRDRPEFRMVTGTSTGSLIATFAFLGSAYDDALGAAYLGIRGDKDVFEKRFFLSALFSDSLATTGPLRRRLEATITPAILEAVAREAGRGRRLYVGAVDVDGGTFKPFDLTQIASRGGEQARKEYVDALMASTAIPVMFPGVEIAGVTYVDGGLRRNIFLEVVASEVLRLQKEGSAPPDASIYCLINGTLNVGSVQVPRNLLDVARRSVDILLDESTDGNLLRIYLQASKMTPPPAFRITMIPPNMCSAVGSEENKFDPQLMRCLYDEGFKFAKEHPDPWRKEPPLSAEP